MIELTITQTDLERIAEKIRKLDINDQGQALFSGFQSAALFVERALKLNISGPILKVRSGRLRSSIGSMITFEDNSLKAVIGSGARQGERVSYANIHETGGTITPKAGSFLTIPLKAAMTSAGVQRFTARDVINNRTKYITSFIRKGIIFGVLPGKSNRITPLFILKTSVNIPARYYMSRTTEETSGEVVNIILRKIDEVLNQ